MKIRFVKHATYGDTWTGYAGQVAAWTIKRTYSYGRTGGYVYTLYRPGSCQALEVSCFLADVTRRARAASAFEACEK